MLRQNRQQIRHQHRSNNTQQLSKLQPSSSTCGCRSSSSACGCRSSSSTCGCRSSSSSNPLCYSTTPLGPELPSPAKLLFGRQLVSNLPLKVTGPSEDAIRRIQQERSEQIGNLHHKLLPDLQPDQDIYFRDVAKNTWSPGTVVGLGPEPRSYTVQCQKTGGGTGNCYASDQHQHRSSSSNHCQHQGQWYQQCHNHPQTL